MDNFINFYFLEIKIQHVQCVYLIFLSQYLKEFLFHSRCLVIYQLWTSTD